MNVLLVAALSCLLVFGTGISQSQAGPAKRIVPQRVLVKFKDTASSEEIRALLDKHSARIQGQIRDINVSVLSLPAAAIEHRVAGELRNQNEVEFAEVDQLLPPAETTTNDPYFTNQWELARVLAPVAWDVTMGSPSVVVAIIDTGVDSAHPDLVPNLVPGWNIYDNNSDSRDVYGHGTKVAGSVAAAGNNGIGVAGLCNRCGIMPLRVSDTSGWATFSAIATAINYAANNGARVANASYIASSSATVQSAVANFQKKGGVFTSSAGNNGTLLTDAEVPSILTVGGTDSNDLKYSWSNYGNIVDVVAPGCVTTTLRGGGYGGACGTSFSAPMTAALAGLILSAAPGLSTSQVIDIIQRSADDIGAAGRDTTFGFGRINASRALALALSTAPNPTPTPTPTPTPAPTDLQAPQITILSPSAGSTLGRTTKVTVQATDNVGVVAVDLYIDGVKTATSTSSPFTTSFSSRKLTTGAHTLQVKARDAAGNVGDSTVITVYK